MHVTQQKVPPRVLLLQSADVLIGQLVNVMVHGCMQTVYSTSSCILCSDCHWYCQAVHDACTILPCTGAAPGWYAIHITCVVCVYKQASHYVQCGQGCSVIILVKTDQNVVQVGLRITRNMRRCLDIVKVLLAHEMNVSIQDITVCAASSKLGMLLRCSACV